MNTISTCTAPSSPATHYCFFRLPTRACCWTAAVHAIFQSLQCKQMDPCAWATCVLCLFAQLCLTLCDPMDCGPPGSSVHGDFPGKNTRVGCHALLQGLFPIQGLNPGLQHCRWILYHLSHQGSLSYKLASKTFWHFCKGTWLSKSPNWTLNLLLIPKFCLLSFLTMNTSISKNIPCKYSFIHH